MNECILQINFTTKIKFSFEMLSGLTFSCFSQTCRLKYKSMFYTKTKCYQLKKSQPCIFYIDISVCGNNIQQNERKIRCDNKSSAVFIQSIDTEKLNLYDLIL